MVGNPQIENGVDIEAALVERGVNSALAAWIVLWLDVPTIERTLAWYDTQQGRVGPGVLVAELRRGGPPAQKHHSMLEEQREYGEQIAAWLSEHLPDLDRPRFGPHPAAVAELIRLHWRHGKQWGPPGRAVATQIRQAVKGFEREWGPDTSDQQEVTQ